MLKRLSKGTISVRKDTSKKWLGPFQEPTRSLNPRARWGDGPVRETREVPPSRYTKEKEKLRW